MKDLRQTRNWASYLQTLNWKVKKIDGQYVYIRDIPFLPLTIVKIQRSTKNIPEHEIKKLLSKHRISIVYIEPSSELRKNYYLAYKYHLSKSTSLPSKTIIIDLKKSLNRLLDKVSKKARYGIRLSQKNNIEIELSHNVNKFIEMWTSQLVSKKRLLSQSKEIASLKSNFTQNSSIIMFANHNNHPIAGIMLILSNKVSHYMYAVSTKEGYRLSAPTILVWEAMKYSKNRKMELFDFEGIYDIRFPIKSWIGFSNFKKSFGGREFEYPVSVQKTYFPWSL